MGYSVSMIAVRGKKAEAIHAEYRVKATGESEEEPESPLVGALLPDGWYLIYINDRIVPDDVVLAKLSRGAELVCCDVEEHVMCSHAGGWRDGKQTWSVTHDSQQGITHLETSGTLPAAFAAIKEELETKQRERNDADYTFDIPVELARALTGFRYDGNADGYPVEEFEILGRVQSSKRWWEFWK